jgi:choline dehydrogenase
MSNPNTYDYVIVGAGSAGCVLAARLTEDADTSVLLVEAGPPDNNEGIPVPLANFSFMHSSIDWDYYSGSEEFCGGRRIPLPRGRTLGGSSAINGMIYVRANPLDYDGWRDAGCEGWGWDELQPYFERSVETQGVAYTRSRDAMSEAFIEAAVEAGHRRSEDFNSGTQDGFGYYQMTQRDGRRCSTADAYLRPAMGRPNLTVETDLLVRKVVLDGTQAVAVEGIRNGTGENLRFECDREVIVAGGSYNTPQLLMLSGIGPADHIATRMIEPLVDIPQIGQNLQDHIQLWPAWASDQPTDLRRALDPENAAANFASFNEGSGPLTSNGGEAGGFIRTSGDLVAPDVQFHAIPFPFGDDPPRGEFGWGVTLGLCLLTPKSRGEVFLSTTEATAKPCILHRFFEAEEDMERIEAGVEAAFELAEQPALSPYCQKPYNLPASRSQEDVRAWVRQNARTLYHPVGTCTMGAAEDDPVDPQLRVRGVDGLRVVDCSVMPTVPRGNTNGPIIAMAERASDLIRGAVAVA